MTKENARGDEKGPTSGNSRSLEAVNLLEQHLTEWIEPLKRQTKSTFELHRKILSKHPDYPPAHMMADVVGEAIGWYAALYESATRHLTKTR
jgi:hypothetical protein